MYVNTYSKRLSAVSDFDDKESVILNAEWF